MGDECAIIAYSFAMIVFPALVLVPSIYGFIIRDPDLLGSVWVVVPWWIAAFSLIIGITFVDIRLFQLGTAWGLALLILMSMCGLAVLIFLWVLPQFIFELALVAKYKEAKSADIANPTAPESPVQLVGNEAES